MERTKFTRNGEEFLLHYAHIFNNGGKKERLKLYMSVLIKDLNTDWATLCFSVAEDILPK